MGFMVNFQKNILPTIWIIGGISSVVIVACFLHNKYSFNKIEKLKASNKAKLLSKKGL